MLELFDRAVAVAKFGGVDIAAWKSSGVDIAAAKYEGIVLQ